MATQIKIERFEGRSPRFWSLMGPVFAGRAYRKEFPHLHDDEGYIWFLGLDGDKVAGGGACHIVGTTGHLHGIFVMQPYAGAGLYSRLVSERIDFMRSKGVKVIRIKAFASSVPVLEALGFKATGKFGTVVPMELKLEE